MRTKWRNRNGRVSEWLPLQMVVHWCICQRPKIWGDQIWEISTSGARLIFIDLGPKNEKDEIKSLPCDSKDEKLDQWESNEKSLVIQSGSWKRQIGLGEGCRRIRKSNEGKKYGGLLLAYVVRWGNVRDTFWDFHQVVKNLQQRWLIRVFCW